MANPARALRATLLAALIAGATAVPAVAQDTVLPAAERYRPSAVPDRVILIPTADPAHSQTVNWRSTAQTPRAQIIEAPAAFGDVHSNAANFPPYDGTNYGSIVTVAATTSTVGTGNAGYQNRYHTVTFTNLKPNTRYSYRVGDGTNPTPSTSGAGAGSVSNWGPWQDFTTADTALRPYSFIYFGDAQNYIDSAVPRVFHQAVYSRPEARILLHAGDLVNETGTSGGNLAVQEKEWAEWYAAAGFNNQTRNVIATPGNHEYNSSTAISAFWKPQFPNPENGPKNPDGTPLEAVRRSVYYVDYQGVRYISLDSSPLQNGPVQQNVLAATNAWLTEVLSDPNRPKWTVVTFHHPVYSGTSTRNNQVVRDNWNPLFAQYGVDLVLQGHDHVYNRGNRIADNDAVDPTKSHGTVYSISVSGGKMYTLNAGQNWTSNGAVRRVFEQNIQLYQLIDVEHDTLTFQARLANGRFFDGYRIDKPGTSWNAPKVVSDITSDPDAAPEPSEPGPVVETPVGGTVDPTLALALGAAPTFGAFAAGVEQAYETSVAATVVSTAGNAALTVADPSATATGHLVNGSSSLPLPLRTRAASAAGTGDSAFRPVGGSAAPTALLAYAAPVSNDVATVALEQRIGATDALRTGTYSKTLTFTLSTTAP